MKLLKYINYINNIFYKEILIRISFLLLIYKNIHKSNMGDIYNESLAEDRDNFLNSIFDDSNLVDTDSTELLDEANLMVDLDEVNDSALKRSTDIIEHLSGYYFDDRYIQEHPYIKNKITQEIDNIRRLLKMLTINEKAQDSLIRTITCVSGKSALYTALTSLQNSILSVQKQLDESVNNIEEIFRKMQDECKTTFDSKEKETLEDGSLVCRGTRDFLKELTEKINMQNITIKQSTYAN